MKQLLVAAGLLLLGACDDDPSVEVVVPLPAPTELLVEAENTDPYDYALWLEWQDGTGAWNQTYLFSVYGDPAYGPTQDFEILRVCPDCPYTVLLADLDGTLWDTYDVWASPGNLTEARFQVVNSVLVRTF